MDRHFEGSLTGKHVHRWTGEERYRMAIDVLPDVVLLEMFDYYVNQVREGDSPDVTVESWRTLVHVCRNWRSVVFGSPRRLNLRLLCTPETPVRKTLAVWPCLPIFVQQRQYGLLGGDSDNIVAALEHNDRVCEMFNAGAIGGTNNINWRFVGKTTELRRSLFSICLWVAVDRHLVCHISI